MRDIGRPALQVVLREGQPRLMLGVALDRERPKRDRHDRERDTREPPRHALPHGARTVKADDDAGDDRHQRQIHSPLRANLSGDRNDARRRRERDEQPRAEKCRGSIPSKRRDRQQQQRDDGGCVRKDIQQRIGNRRSVVDDEVTWPESEPKVPHDHHGLVQQVRPHADAGCEAGRPCARRRDELQRENHPREREGGIEPPAHSDRRAERIEQEGAIEEHDHHRCGDHRFLHAHTERARDNGHDRPSSDRPIVDRRSSMRERRLAYSVSR